MAVEYRGLPVSRRRVSRRRFVQGAGVAGLGLLAGCGRWPGQAPLAQPAGGHRVGWLQDAAAPAAFLATFRHELAILGYVEGVTLTIQAGYAETVEQLPDLAARLLAAGVQVMVVSSTPAARAAKAATSTLPVVFNLIADPVGQGLVMSLARPGGNVTGLSNLSTTLGPKRLELLHAAVPSHSGTAVFWNATNPTLGQQVQAIEEAAVILGVEVRAFPVHQLSELEGVFEAALSRGTEALLDLTAPFSPRTAELVTQYRLPAMFQTREHAAAGGLMSYGPNQPESYRQVAAYVDKILRGAQPVDLPVEQPTRFDCVINLRTAQTLGLTIPPHVLLQATEIIQ